MSAHSILLNLSMEFYRDCAKLSRLAVDRTSRRHLFCRLVHTILSQLRQLGERDRSKGDMNAVLAPSSAERCSEV